MGTSPAAVLARIKVNYPAWAIRKLEQADGRVLYRAERAGTGDVIRTAELGDLERKLHARSNGGAA
jgi:hypothetical protein